ncbi:MAG: hypothetical protein AAGA77_01300 [Bacteroidota bacterium]
MTKDFDQIRMCLFQIEKKLDWGNSDSWHNDVFIELSRVIQEETNVLLSPTTLKRVWGKVNYNSNPSINTLNTLAQFSGYLNWRDFKSNNASKPVKQQKPKITFAQFKVLGTTLLLSAIIASILLAMRGKNEEYNEPLDFSDVIFTSKPVTKGLPNSVLFDFDLKGIQSDSIFIQQYWDRTKRIKVHSDQKQATGQYYFPGYFRAKLVVDGVIGLEHDLFIKSEGWMGTIDYEPVPKYYEQAIVLEDNLGLPTSALKEIQQSEKPLVSSFHFVDDLGEVSGDNFELETSFRNLYNDKWAVCSSTRIVVLGSKGALVIPFSIPGCVSEIGLMLNENYLSGKEHDLSAFGTDLSKFQTFGIRVQEKAASISIDGREIYNGAYQETIGKLVGLRFRFLGAGEIENLSVIDLQNNRQIFTEGFEVMNRTET